LLRRLTSRNRQYDCRDQHSAAWIQFELHGGRRKLQVIGFT